MAPTGNDANSCATPDSPCLTINGAISKAGAGEDVLVGAGTYTSTDSAPVVVIAKNVHLLGSWNSTFTAHDGVSIIDGQDARRGMLVSTGATIDRFVIRHGYGSGSGGAGVTIAGHAWDTVTISNSTIRDNSLGEGSGGGIYVSANTLYDDGADLILSNSTVGGNAAPHGTGGGIYYNGGLLTIQNSTIVHNSSGAAGGLYAVKGQTVGMRNSILAHNHVGSVVSDCSGTMFGAVRDPFQISRYNIIGNTGGCPVKKGTGNHYNVDPGIASAPIGLAGYYPLVPGSPALDGGAAAGCPATDERGVPRPQGSACDMGAFEYRGGGTVPVYLLPLHDTAQYVLIRKPARLSPAALVLDANGDPVAGVQVTFTAPASGPSGTFSNRTNTISVATANDGIAAPGTFTANSTEGSYTVQASALGIGSHATFSLTNGAQNVKTYTMKHSKTRSRLPGTFLCDLTYPGCTNSADLDADQAESFAYGTYLFYRSRVQRNSLDDAGRPIIVSVHYGNEYGNAFWDGREVVLGDRWASDDTVAHELTHGVTQYTSGLFYFYQSGAINESLSDIFGELYDQSNGVGKDGAGYTWFIGEDVPDGPIRSMSNPPQFGDPDRMSNYDTSEMDNGSVHSNSGINNKAAHLMVQGGSFNGRSVAEIGADKTLAIYYEAETHLLTSGSDYADLYNALYQACLNLLEGQAGISTADCQSVRNATDAVEMNVPVAGRYNPEAPLCDPGLSPVNVFSDDFESGAGRWSFSTQLGTQRWQLDSPYGRFAHSGKHFLYADDYPAAITDTSAEMKTGVKLPANAYLHFAQAYNFERYAVTYGPWFDGGVLEYSTDKGITWNDAGKLIINNGYGGTIFPYWYNPLAGRRAFVGTSHGYISTRLNLASLANKTVKFRWRMGLDDIGYMWGWWLDDVRIYTCGSFGKLGPTPGAPNQKGTLTLSWKPAAGATSYDYCYSKTEGACPLWHQQGSASSVSISGLDPNSTYYWQVRANTSGGTFEADTGWWSFSTGAPPADFGKLEPANDATDQALQPTLSWIASSGATSYDYCFDTIDNSACDGSWSQTASTSASLKDLALNTTYYWQVRAHNSFKTDADTGSWFRFTTAPSVFTISGNAAVGGSALTFIGSTTNGNVNGVATADVNGDYSFGLPPGWSGSVTPSKAGATFTPSSLDYDNLSADRPDQDYSVTLPFVSVAAQDGWIVESGELTRQGGAAYAKDATISLGDDALNNQYRAVLSFATGSLPDNAEITGVTLRLTKQSIVGGGNPFTMFKGMMVDLKKGFFGTMSALQASDFQAQAGQTITPAAQVAGAVYTFDLGSAAGDAVNKLSTYAGVTQLRLRFKLDDNNNLTANYIKLFSGNYATTGYRPALVIKYYVP